MLSGILSKQKTPGCKFAAILTILFMAISALCFDHAEDKRAIELISEQLSLGDAEYARHNIAGAMKHWSEGSSIKSRNRDSNIVIAKIECKLGQLLREKRSYAEAIAIAERAYTKLKKQFGARSRQAWHSACLLSELKYESGNYSFAENLASDLVFSAQENFGTQNKKTAVSLNLHGMCLAALKRYSQAIPLFSKSLSILKYNKAAPEQILTVENNLATTYSNLRQYKLAGKLLEDCISKSKTLKNFDPSTRASFLNNLGIVYETQQKYLDAEIAYEEAICIREKVNGKDHPLTAIAITNSAHLNKHVGKLKKSEEQYILAIQIFRKNFKTDHPYVRAARNSLAYVYEAQGKTQQAWITASEAQQ